MKVATDPKENMETIIVKGLEGMRVSDFVEGSARYKHSSGELSVVQLGLERLESHFKCSLSVPVVRTGGINGLHLQRRGGLRN